MDRTNLLLLPVSLALLACAQTSVTSYKDPAHSQATCTYIVITARIEGLGHQQAIEDSFVVSLKDAGVKESRGIDMWPPTRAIAKEEMASTFLKSDADCLLAVSLKEGTTEAQTYETIVLEKASMSKIWIGSSSTQTITDTAHSILTKDIHMSAMFDSMAKGIVGQLVKDGVIKQRM
jgi:hypothetical protein